MKHRLLFFTLYMLAIQLPKWAQAANPLIAGQGVCDPHIHIFNNRAYLFTGHDTATNEWRVPDWQVWSSGDLVAWKRECLLKPEETYIGKPFNGCWATDGAERNGKYFFYFSNVNHDTGVAVASAPGGPYRDALGKPLLPAKLTPTRSYDPTVFVDDDEKRTPYIVFGTPKWAGGDSYYMARLNEDMISLAETPRKIILQNPDGSINPADDKNFLHKHNGIYYLSWQAYYATATNVYGPYTCRGNVGTTHDHASFCQWNNQWFMCYTIFDPTPFHRAPGLCYIHFKDNGEMAAVEPVIKAYGVGRYDGTWEKIEAEWYMAASAGTSKREIPGDGFEVRIERDGAWLYFPKVENLPADAPVSFRIASAHPGGALIEIRKAAVDGELLGTCAVPDTGGWNQYKAVTGKLKNRPGPNDLYLVFKGTGGGGLLRLDWMSFK